MAVPYTFATATGSLPLSQLDANFSTGIVIGNTTVTLGDTITTINNLTLANVTVTSASFSNVTLSGTTTVSGNTTVFSATGARIQGDFSNATLASRTAFQDKTTNNVTGVAILPNGTAVESAVTCFNNSDPTNASYGGINCNATGVRLTSANTGSGSALPLIFITGAGGPEVARFDTSGNFMVGTATAKGKFTVNGALSWTTGATFAGSNGNNAWATGFGSQAISASIQASDAIAGASIYSVSDVRLKTNISTLPDGLAFVNTVSPVQFTWKDSNQQDTGFIAQDLLSKGFGHLVSEIQDGAMQEYVDADGNVSPAGSRFIVKYDSVVPILCKAIKEQQTLIIQLEARVAALEAA
jgi:hypothetical protein